MRTLTRYVAFQVPGWVMAALVLAALARWWAVLEPRTALALFALWVLKDFALFPLVRRAYERRPVQAGDELVGARGVAQQALDPAGYVRVGAELWRACVTAGHGAVPAGARVRVCGVRELTLLVEPDPGETGEAA